MATVTGLTAARMLEIEAASVIDGDVVDGNLILTKHDGTQIDAGNVEGPAGPPGPQGFSSIPGEVKLWPGATLPDPAIYGKYAWANGDPFDVSAYPLAAANIDPRWKTAHGLPDPGAGKFRVPDLRGVTPAGLDAMPVGSTRANRTTRPEALLIGAKTGSEKVALITNELPSHGHPFVGNALPAHGHAGSTFTGNALPGHGHVTAAEWKAAYAANSSSIVITDIDNKSGASAGNAINAATSVVSAGTPSGVVGIAAASAGTPSGTVSPVGGGAAHENMQPTIFVPYIVKLDD
jgi:microcystin-dependent protein